MAKIKTATADSYCKMGNEITPVYMLSRKKWFDKKIIEKVLTGKNQHNLLGQATDPKNHMVVIDGETLRMVEIISESGVRNYLKKARSVTDESKQDFYTGLKRLSSEKFIEVSKEPLQPQLQMIPFVRIERKMDGGIFVDFWNDKQNDEERKREAISMLTDGISKLIVTN